MPAKKRPTSSRRRPARSWWSQKPVAIRAAYGGALIGALAALVTALISQLVPNDPASPLVGENNGDLCIAQGPGSTVFCDPALPRSLGDVKVGTGALLWALFRGNPEDIPSPSAFDGDQAQGRDCEQWPKWLTSVSKLYMIDPTFTVGLQAGTADVVTIRRIDAEIISKEKIPEAGGQPATLIKCLYGGGSNPGLLVDVDTVNRQTTITELNLDDSSKNQSYAMPPGSINQSETGYLGADIQLSSMEGYFYRGRLLIQATVNGEDRTYEIGSAKNPIQWIADPTGRFSDQTMPYYGWDSGTTRWTQGLKIG